MPGLGDTVSDLMQFRSFMRGPEGGRDLTPLVPVRPHGSNPGALRMWSFVPPGLPPGAPLVVVLHGCTQTASGYDHGAGWSTLAARHGFALLFPEQTSDNNANLCFNWFQPGDVTRDHGEVLSIREMIGQMVDDHALNPARVYLTGLSAGAAMGAAALATYPELFAGAALIAGLPYGSATGLQGAFEAMHHIRPRSRHEWGELVRAASAHRGPWPPVQVWHGGADPTVRPGNYDEMLKQWADVHGVPEAPGVERLEGATHRIWHDAGGRVVLEGFMVEGLAHGLPLDLAAADLDQSVGAAGPYMLPAGLSSTWRIARSWGLLTQAARMRAVGETQSSEAASPGALLGKVLRAVGLGD